MIPTWRERLATQSWLRTIPTGYQIEAMQSEINDLRAALLTTRRENIKLKADAWKALEASSAYKRVAEIELARLRHELELQRSGL